MAKSERLQLQKIREDSESDDQWALVLFEEEDTYSVVEKHRIKEEHYAYGQVVNVLWGKGRLVQYYLAKLIICGSKDDCEKESLDLSFSNNQETHKESEIFENPEKCTSTPKRAHKASGSGEVESKKTKKGPNKSTGASSEEAMSEEQHLLDKAIKTNSLQRSPPFSKNGREVENRLNAIFQKLENLEEKVDKVLHQSQSAFKGLPANEKNNSKIHVADTGSDEEKESDLVYNGIDLLGLKAPPKEPTRYATRVAGVIFTTDELLTGMVPPVNEKYDRTPLDPDRIALLKKCITRKYSEKVVSKMWCDIRKAINQKCNDLRKKS